MDPTARSLPNSTLGTPTPEGRAIRRLQPINEPINGLRAYENKQGDVFVLKEVRYPTGVFSDSRSIHLSLEQVAADSQQAYRLTARMTLNGERLSIDSIKTPEDKSGRYPKPPETRRGYDFFKIFLEEAKRIAKELGAKVIKMTPANEELVPYYHKFGFQGLVEVTLQV